MSEGTSHLIDSHSEGDQDASLHPLALRLREILNLCSKSVKTGDLNESAEAVSKVVDFLNSVSSAAVSDPDSQDSKEKDAVMVLTELMRFISSPSLDQEVIDALSFELPKAVAKFGGVSHKCQELVESLVSHLISTCNPRDMLSVLCDALGSPDKMVLTPAYVVPILTGLSKVFLCIQRRVFEQLKAAVPGILNALKVVSSELDDEEKNSITDLISRVIGIATSMQSASQKLEGRRKEELNALLGLFVLQIMALLSRGMTNELQVQSCVPLVVQLSRFLPVCGLSYIGLITGCDIDAFTNSVCGEDSDDDYASCFSYVKHGGALTVIWGYTYDEVSKAAEEDLAGVKDKLCSSKTKTWEAVGMLKYILSSVDQPWLLKKHAIDFLLCIMDRNTSQNCIDDHTDCLIYMPSLFSSIKAIEMVIIYAPDAELRKNAFSALKRVLADIPSYQRFDILKGLLTNNNFPSMIAILLDLVREEMRKDIEIIKVENTADKSTPFWSADVLEFVELVLKPPKGGPPSLPEDSDAERQTTLGCYQRTLYVGLTWSGFYLCGR
ncbi:aberrant root formation protein 4 isoform X2 [Telopea speciosissima]|uniref:aberrant root formation protein 4 isoform X2 n=1 Tax=Telopea speciosissima TaxID=54955 RepID=UPI001CC4D519|nr:aberrant root formation protein 4 isoform X2 [Telopea speciosissima]